MEENYLLAKIIVSNKYEENNPYYPLFVVAIYALLNKYPNEHLVINEIFSKTDIYIEKDTIQNILDKYPSIVQMHGFYLQNLQHYLQEDI